MAHRIFIDSYGRRWDVWEVVPTSVERRRLGAAAPIPDPPGYERRRQATHRALLSQKWAGGWLAFETPGERRRVPDFPADWMDMTPEELEELCDRGIIVPPRRRLIE